MSNVSTFRRRFGWALLVALLCAVAATPVEAGRGAQRALVIAVLEELGITSGGTPVSGGATVTATTALIVGAATTAGVRLDLESGDLAVREGDDSAYGNVKALAFIGGAGTLNVESAANQNLVLKTGSINALSFSYTSNPVGTFNGPVRFTDGTAALPAITGSDTNSGIFFGADAVDISTNGGSRILVRDGAITFATQINGNGNLLYACLENVANRTGDVTLDYSSSFATNTNAGAAGEAILSLGPASAGYRYRFVVEAAQYLRVKAATGDLIRGTRAANVVAGTIESSATAGYWRSNVAGAWIEVLAIDGTTWQVVGIGGTWTIDS